MPHPESEIPIAELIGKAVLKEAREEREKGK